ncbi:MAG: hypothetical protein K2V38_09295, partial [Gemmataceae bacterium]|nr:hypothetical protein [Gemmataceae bacterium]
EGPVPLVLSGKPEHPRCLAWSIDVGAFTTDFTALTVDTGGKLTEDPEDALFIREHSVPLGVGDLDQRVLEVLPEAQRRWLARAGHLDWEDFRNSVYTLGRPFTTAEVGAIGGIDTRPQIDQVLARFGQELATACSAFRGEHEAPPLQELILTGGGNAIPAVHQALIAAMQDGGYEYVHIYVPALGRRIGTDKARRLEPTLVRGGSAIGGASVYFEKCFY